jgi:hypothetical protein
VLYAQLPQRPWPVSSHDIIEDRSEWEDIGSTIDWFWAFTRLLRRHIPESADNRFRPSPARVHQPFGNAPIYDEHFTEAPDHDVLRFQVAMDNAALMSECDHITYLLEYAKPFEQAVFSGKKCVEAFSPHKSHRVIDSAVRQRSAVIDWNDPWMLKPCKDFRFFTRIRARVSRSEMRIDYLDRDVPIQASVSSRIDYPHSSAPQLFA